MLHYFGSFLIALRNYYKYKTRKVVLVVENKNIKNNYVVWFVQLLSFLNLINVINYFNYNYLYFIDDMYYYYVNEKPHNKIVFSVINRCCIKNENVELDITDNIIKYSLDVPMYIIYINENIQTTDLLSFEVLHFGQKKIKTYTYDEVKDKKLCEII